MAAGQTLSIQLHGGGPWGFRLQGGGQVPLTVAKVRKGSKAFQGDLREGDTILYVNGQKIHGKTHQQAMDVVDAAGTHLKMDVQRGGQMQHYRPANSQVPEYKPVYAHGVDPQPAVPRHKLAPPVAQKPNVSVSPSTPTDHLNGSFAPGGLTGILKPTQKPEPATASEPPAHTWCPPSMKNKQVTPTSVPVTVTVTETTHAMTNGYGYHDTNEEEKQAHFPIHPVTDVSSPPHRKLHIWSPMVAFTGEEVMQTEEERERERKAKFQNKIASFPGAHLAPGEKPMFQVKHIDAAKEVWTPSIAKDVPDYKPMSVSVTALSEADSGYPESPMTPATHDHPPNVSLDLSLINNRRDSELSTPDSGKLRKKVFSDSAFYDEPDHLYPTVEEQIDMARRVAKSLEAAVNKRARGGRMFAKRKRKSSKWVHSGAFSFSGVSSEGSLGDQVGRLRDFDDEYDGTLVHHDSGHDMYTSGHVPLWPVDVAEGDHPVDKSVLTPSEVEHLRLEGTKNLHNIVTPQVCHDIAADLQKQKGRGAKIFAKQRARAERYVTDETNVRSPPPPAPQLTYRLNQMTQSPGKNYKSPWQAAMDNPYDLDPAFAHMNRRPLMNTKIITPQSIPVVPPQYQPKPPESWKRTSVETSFVSSNDTTPQHSSPQTQFRPFKKSVIPSAFAADAVDHTKSAQSSKSDFNRKAKGWAPVSPGIQNTTNKGGIIYHSQQTSTAPATYYGSTQSLHSTGSYSPAALSPQPQSPRSRSPAFPTQNVVQSSVYATSHQPRPVSPAIQAQKVQTATYATSHSPRPVSPAVTKQNLQSSVYATSFSQQPIQPAVPPQQISQTTVYTSSQHSPSAMPVHLQEVEEHRSAGPGFVRDQIKSFGGNTQTSGVQRSARHHFSQAANAYVPKPTVVYNAPAVPQYQPVRVQQTRTTTTTSYQQPIRMYPDQPKQGSKYADYNRKIKAWTPHDMNNNDKYELSSSDDEDYREDYRASLDKYNKAYHISAGAPAYRPINFRGEGHFQNNLQTKSEPGVFEVPAGSLSKITITQQPTVKTTTEVTTTRKVESTSNVVAPPPCPIIVPAPPPPAEKTSSQTTTVETTEVKVAPAKQMVQSSSEVKVESCPVIPVATTKEPRRRRQRNAPNEETVAEVAVSEVTVKGEPSSQDTAQVITVEVEDDKKGSQEVASVEVSTSEQVKVDEVTKQETSASSEVTVSESTVLVAEAPKVEECKSETTTEVSITTESQPSEEAKVEEAATEVSITTEQPTETKTETVEMASTIELPPENTEPEKSYDEESASFTLSVSAEADAATETVTTTEQSEESASFTLTM